MPALVGHQLGHRFWLGPAQVLARVFGHTGLGPSSSVLFVVAFDVLMVSWLVMVSLLLLLLILFPGFSLTNWFPRSLIWEHFDRYLQRQQEG